MTAVKKMVLFSLLAARERFRLSRQHSSAQAADCSYRSVHCGPAAATNNPGSRTMPGATLDASGRPDGHFPRDVIELQRTGAEQQKAPGRLRQRFRRLPWQQPVTSLAVASGRYPLFVDAAAAAEAVLAMGCGRYKLALLPSSVTFDVVVY